jgi:hypothetical protein
LHLTSQPAGQPETAASGRILFVFISIPIPSQSTPHYHPHIFYKQPTTTINGDMYLTSSPFPTYLNQPPINHLFFFVTIFEKNTNDPPKLILVCDEF